MVITMVLAPQETPHVTTEVYLFLDESGTSVNDSMTMVGATAFYDVRQAEDRIKITYERVLGDPSFWTGQERKRTVFRENGFHFTEDNDSVRDALLTAMGEIQFRAYAAYAKNDRTLSTAERLIQMYGTLLQSVLTRYRHARISVIFEQNPVMNSHYGQLWTALRSEINGLDSATAYIGTKRAPCLSVTDYVLGVTQAHLASGAMDYHRRRFAALGRKYAYLVDFDDDRHLGGRKHPIL